MKIAYLDCASGISGDMMLGALIDAGASLEVIQAGIDSLGLPDCRLEVEEVRRHGFRATNLTVHHAEQHAHRHLSHIVAMIDGSQLTPPQKDVAKRIFTRLGEAEAKVHGASIEKVHFHEVGAVDSIADIVGVAIGFDLLAVERVVASPVPTGSGFIEIAHGRCRVPAPATAELLRGAPIERSDIEAELTTPTGAAILATLVEEYSPMPSMRVDRIGCGAGDRQLDRQANLLRLILGAADGSAPAGVVWMVETNLDDATGESIGYCVERLWQAGALDVFTTAVQMKKNRPGVALSVMCNGEDVERIERLIFTHTTTLGLRSYSVGRRTLSRRPVQVTTPWGPVDGMVAELGDGQLRFSPEFEACRRVADERDVPLDRVVRAAQSAFDQTGSAIRREV